MKAVEVKLARWHERKSKTNIGGRWCTKKYLQDHCFYTKDMIDNSFAHARAKGLVRINPVHKEEEARLVIDETFDKTDTRGESTQLTSAGDVEDRGVVF